MNYLDLIDSITTKLVSNNHVGAAQGFQDLKSSASTGSELLLSVTHKLILLNATSVDISDLIGDEICELVEYCRSIGLYVR